MGLLERKGEMESGNARKEEEEDEGGGGLRDFELALLLLFCDLLETGGAVEVERGGGTAAADEGEDFLSLFAFLPLLGVEDSVCLVEEVLSAFI